MLIKKVEGNLTRLVNPDLVAYAEYCRYINKTDNELNIETFAGPLRFRGIAAVSVMEMLEPFISKQRPEVG